MNYIEKLRAYAPKALLGGQYVSAPQAETLLHCAIGACLPDGVTQILRENNNSPVYYLAHHADIAELLRACGLDTVTAGSLQRLNDGILAAPAERYELLMRALSLIEAGKWTLFDAACAVREPGFRERLDAVERGTPT